MCPIHSFPPSRYLCVCELAERTGCPSPVSVLPFAAGGPVARRLSVCLFLSSLHAVEEAVWWKDEMCFRDPVSVFLHLG